MFEFPFMSFDSYKLQETVTRNVQLWSGLGLSDCGYSITIWLFEEVMAPFIVKVIAGIALAFAIVVVR